MSKKKILSLLATFMTGLSLAPSSRSMAHDHPTYATKFYNTTNKTWQCFAKEGAQLSGNEKEIFKDNNNVTVKRLEILREENRTGDYYYFLQPYASYNNYYYYVAGFKKYIDDKQIQISEEGFLLDPNLNFVDPSGEKIDLAAENPIVYKVNVKLKGFENSEDRMINKKLESLEDIEIVQEEDDVVGGLENRKRPIFKVNDGNVFYLAYKDNETTYILKNSDNDDNGEIESVKLDNVNVDEVNKARFIFNADYLKFSCEEANNDIGDSVKRKFVQQEQQGQNAQEQEQPPPVGEQHHQGENPQVGNHVQPPPGGEQHHQGENPQVGNHVQPPPGGGQHHQGENPQVGNHEQPPPVGNPQGDANTNWKKVTFITSLAMLGVGATGCGIKKAIKEADNSEFDEDDYDDWDEDDFYFE